MSKIVIDGGSSGNKWKFFVSNGEGDKIDLIDSEDWSTKTVPKGGTGDWNPLYHTGKNFKFRTGFLRRQAVHFCNKYEPKSKLVVTYQTMEDATETPEIMEKFMGADERKQCKGKLIQKVGEEGMLEIYGDGFMRPTFEGFCLSLPIMHKVFNTRVIWGTTAGIRQFLGKIFGAGSGVVGEEEDECWKNSQDFAAKFALEVDQKARCGGLSNENISGRVLPIPMEALTEWLVARGKGELNGARLGCGGGSIQITSQAYGEPGTGNYLRYNPQHCCLLRVAAANYMDNRVGNAIAHFKPFVEEQRKNYLHYRAAVGVKHLLNEMQGGNILFLKMCDAIFRFDGTHVSTTAQTLPAVPSGGDGRNVFAAKAAGLESLEDSFKDQFAEQSEGVGLLSNFDNRSYIISSKFPEMSEGDVREAITNIEPNCVPLRTKESPLTCEVAAENLLSWINGFVPDLVDMRDEQEHKLFRDWRGRGTGKEDDKRRLGGVKGDIGSESMTMGDVFGMIIYTVALLKLGVLEIAMEGNDLSNSTTAKEPVLKVRKGAPNLKVKIFALKGGPDWTDGIEQLMKEPYLQDVWRKGVSGKDFDSQYYNQFFTI